MELHQIHGSIHSKPPAHLAEELPAGGKGETERLRVVLQDVLDAVVELGVHCLHVFQGDLLTQEHLVERANEVGCVCVGGGGGGGGRGGGEARTN